MIPRILLPCLCLLLATSCNKDLLFSKVENTSINNFEIFWSEFDKYYPYFELKKINWDSIYQVYRPQVNEKTSDKQLYEIFKNIALCLKDGHVNVFTPLGTIQYTGWYDKYPINKLDRKVFLKKYVPNSNSNAIFDYGYTSNKIGYIAINTFDGGEHEFEFIDSILIQLNRPSKLIIDIRNNSGGYNSNAAIISGRFTNKTQKAYCTRYRSGKGRNQFTSWQDYNNYQLVKKPYLNKVVVLTNRGCFSAAEDFLMLMRSSANCSFVGDTTGGGSGNPTFRELPNGWYFRLSTWQCIDRDGNFCESRGIYPDIAVNIKAKELKLGIDAIIERAISILSKE